MEVKNKFQFTKRLTGMCSLYSTGLGRNFLKMYHTVFLTGYL